MHIQNFIDFHSQKCKAGLFFMILNADNQPTSPDSSFFFHPHTIFWISQITITEYGQYRRDIRNDQNRN